jgi:hypothetical protein
MTFVASPVNLWLELPTIGPALDIASLVPYQTAAGYFVFLERGTGPGGSTQGAFVDQTDYVTLETSTTTGLRIARRSDDTLFVY